jgi:hypothetical protein
VGTTPLAYNGGTVTSIIPIDSAGVLNTAGTITLSTSISVPSGSGIFAGYGQILIHNGSRVYRIAIPSGAVTDLGAMGAPPSRGCESWAYWGVAETISGVNYITYVNGNAIQRMRVPTGAVTTVATFSNLGDMCTFTVSPSTGRWYFHYEGGAQFGGSSETVGYCTATFVSGGLPLGSGVGDQCTAGVGACLRTSTVVCNTAQTGTVCSVTAGSPMTEVCNGIDDDCDGMVDNVPSSACSLGPCSTAQTGCRAGITPGTQGVQSEAPQCQRVSYLTNGTVCRAAGGWLRCAGDLQRRQRRVPRRRLRRQRHGVPRGGGHLRRAGDLHGLQRGVSERHAPPDGDPVPRECGRVRRGGELQRHRRDLPGGRAAALGHDVQPAHRRRVQRLRVRVPVGADAVRHHLHHRHLDLHRGRGRLRAHRQLALHDQRLEHRRAEREPGLPARLRADARRPGALLGLQRLRSAGEQHHDQQRACR